MSPDLPDIYHEVYHKYEGNFEFSDGKLVTGGLMDEIQGHLVFIEPNKQSLGGIFEPISPTTFQSLSNPKLQIQYDLNSEGEVQGIWWDTEENSPDFAKKVSNYSIENIEFQSGDIIISGELRLPTSPGPHPVIINVHGSGKVTRHMGPWNTFFLKYGIGVLSYDKRGSGQSSGDFEMSGYKDFAKDVLAAITYLKQNPSIDTTKIGLHASSEGGWVSSIAASKNEHDLAFMIVRAGSGVSGSQTYLYEVKNELQEYDLNNTEYLDALHFEQRIQNMAAKQLMLDSVNSYIDEKRNETWFKKVYKDWDGIGSKRWIQMQKMGPIDPVKYLRNVSNTPVLWFLAMEDKNVPYEKSKSRIKQALTEAKNTDFEIVSFPRANHAFFGYKNRR